MRNRQFSYLCLLDEITRKLQNGQLHQGDPISSEAELAKELRLSKWAVRDAVRDLNTMGILASSKEEGNVLEGRMSESMSKSLHTLLLLKEVSPFEVCQMRRAMEMTALPLAFARRDELDIPELKNLLDQIQCGSILDNIRADEASHMWLMAASGNHLMECVMQAIWGICSTQVNLILSGGTELIQQKLAAVHTQLYKSFAVGDLEMGLNAIDQHYQIIEQVLADLKLG